MLGELLKISDLDTSASRGQDENMRNLILTLATDFRVILVKIAERLFLMRQAELLSEKEQIALALESRSIYSPLAHRLGLYNVMSEMEDISMSILEKKEYESIAEKLKASTQRRSSIPFISALLRLRRPRDRPRGTRCDMRCGTRCDRRYGRRHGRRCARSNLHSMHRLP